MKHLISVIVNCHNGERYLEKCIASIISQKYKNFEIIFFDNFSSDNSKKILDNFKDKRIKYFYSGIKFPLYKARNEAIKKTSGSLIAFLVLVQFVLSSILVTFALHSVQLVLLCYTHLSYVVLLCVEHEKFLLVKDFLG